MPRRLLLISNSTNHGQGYLDHVISEIDDFLGPVRRLVFVPFALKERAVYGAQVRDRLAAIGLQATILTADQTAQRTMRDAEAVFIGGGNTFRLLKALEDLDLLPDLRERAVAGMPFLGASAGANVAAPTIRTTNDMPIVEPASFAALGLVPFQINPHYRDPDPGSTHMGETREERLREYLEEDATPVIGLREGTWIRVEGDRATLGGAGGARIFRPGAAPEERGNGSFLDDLMKT